MTTYNWRKDTFAGFVCDMPNNITLIASPRRTISRGFKLRAANGTKWGAQCSVWEESTRTLSRYGRDAWREDCETAAEARKLAQRIYEEA